MGLLQVAVLLLLGASAFLLRGCSGSSSHSLHYFFTGLPESDQGLPQFTTLGYVDDQLSIQYDSNTRRKVPRVTWIHKAEDEEPDYWDRVTYLCQDVEAVFRTDVEKMKNYYNQSSFHSLQWIVGCELSEDGQKRGFHQYGYDGRDFISFDKETLTWTAGSAGTQMRKRKLDANLAISQHLKDLLEERCFDWLKRYIGYGKEALQRAEPPVVQVTRKADSDGLETLLCQAHGFYPKEIDANWQKDGEVWEVGTFRGVVAPNSDGTYYTLLGIKIDPKDRDHYWCHVEHDGLTEPLDLAWKEPGSNMGLIIGCLVGAVVLLAVLAVGIWVYIKKRQDGYKAALTNDGGSNSSSQGSNPAI